MTPDDDTKAQYRFLVLNIIRITGAAMLVLGLAVIAREAFGLPRAAGYVLFVAGLAEFILVPVFLARKWKSPPQP
ncbi:MAG: hypothetical protein IBJ12_02275 [Sphingomonadaceae bacterium]|nr:hypothetical protein [Sphingomonadaceae bacterium]